MMMKLKTKMMIDEKSFHDDDGDEDECDRVLTNVKNVEMKNDLNEF